MEAEENQTPAAAPRERHRSPADLVLFLAALPLARRAQQVSCVPLPRLVAEMAAEGSGRSADPDRVLRAASRACARCARWFGGVDTCLTRSLVAGALLCGGDRAIELHVGFRPGRNAVVDGHAWLMVDGVRLDAEQPGQHAEPYAEVLEIPFRQLGEEAP